MPLSREERALSRDTRLSPVAWTRVRTRETPASHERDRCFREKRGRFFFMHRSTPTGARAQVVDNPPSERKSELSFAKEACSTRLKGLSPFGDTRLSVVVGGTHMLAVERPDEVAREIDEHLSTGGS